MTTDHIVRSGYLSEDLADSDAENMDDMYDENSSARLFERQRIKALAGEIFHKRFRLHMLLCFFSEKSSNLSLIK